MSPRVVRLVTMAVFFGVGIPGMIVASINDNTGAAVTFGLLTVPAVIALLAVTSVTTGRLPPTAMAPPGAAPAEPGRHGPGSEAEAEALEARVQALVAAGADEEEVRDLVRAAVRLGRGVTNVTQEAQRK